MDGFALFFIGITLAASFTVVLLAYGYLKRRTGRPEEFYALLLAATLGACVLASSDHFASFFLGLETLSVGLFVLVSYLRREVRDIEAGLKYLVLAGASSSLLLFGMALVYASLGTLRFPEMNFSVPPGGASPEVLLCGLALILVGIGFKLGVVPFHMWTPDVYEGAPAPAAAFLATASKGGMFALFLRFMATSQGLTPSGTYLALSVIAVLSMFVGNLLALMQTNVKRLLAYSSISHFGYLLVALLSGNPLAVRAILYYLAAYFVTTLGAFGVIAALSGRERDADALDDYRGLYWRRPWTAAAFTACLLSLAGIPLTAGFVAKFYVVAAGVGSALWALVIVLVANSAIGLYYYLRVVVAMLQKPEEAPAVGRGEASPEETDFLPDTSGPSGIPAAVPTGAGFALAVLMIALLWLGVHPSTLDRVILTMLTGR